MIPRGLSVTADLSHCGMYATYFVCSSSTYGVETTGTVATTSLPLREGELCDMVGRTSASRVSSEVRSMRRLTAWLLYDSRNRGTRRVSRIGGTWSRVFMSSWFESCPLADRKLPVCTAGWPYGLI